MSDLLEMLGLPPSSGQRRDDYRECFIDDDVPTEPTRSLLRPRDRGRPLMTQLDMFAGLLKAGDQPRVDGDAHSGSSASQGSIPTIAEEESPVVLERDQGAAPTRSSSTEALALERQIRGASHENLRSRMAGDIVICAVPPASFLDAVAAIAASGTVTAERLKAFRREVSWIQARRPRESDGSMPRSLPCDPVLLRPILKKIIPGQHKISRKRFYNIVSELQAIQRKTGWLPPRPATTLPTIISGAWLLALPHLDHDARSGMFQRFIGFCEGQGLAPSHVEAAHLAAYETELTRSNRDNPALVANIIRYAWNGICAKEPDFGGKPLAPKPNPRTIRLPDSTIPAAFFTDLAAYIGKLRKPGLFAAGFPVRTSEATIKTRLAIFKLCPSVLVQRGWNPDQFQSLRSILNPAAIEALLTAYHKRNCGDGLWTLGAEATAQALKTAARQWGCLSPEDMIEVGRLCDSVRSPTRTFSPKKLALLAQLDDPKVKRRFLDLPNRLWAKALKLDHAGRLRAAATCAKYAVTLGILLDKPLRISNLANLDLMLDFARDARGAIVGIRIVGDRTTKNAIMIEGQLSPKTIKMLNSFIERFRNRVFENPGSALFPGEKSAHARPGSMSNGLMTVIRREIGANVRPHLIRSFITTIILDEDPRQIQLAQRVLDHRGTTSVTRNYALQRGRAANREYSEIMRRHVRKLERHDDKPSR